MTKEPARKRGPTNPKKLRIAFRPTRETFVYLKTLGYIDGRDGKEKLPNPGMPQINLSEFVNLAITKAIESGAVSTGQATTEDLSVALWEAKMHQLGTENRNTVEKMRWVYDQLEKARQKQLERDMEVKNGQ